ncbi:hypothetical protein ACOMHN_049100 [Nucella lapillus]
MAEKSDSFAVVLAVDHSEFSEYAFKCRQAGPTMYTLKTEESTATTGSSSTQFPTPLQRPTAPQQANPIKPNLPVPAP